LDAPIIIGAIIGVTAKKLLRKVDEVEPPEIVCADNPIWRLNKDIAPPDPVEGIARRRAE
jgi:hypothetical protein